jgi:hypothetical protein
LDRLLSGGDFDPATEETSFRIAATDHTCHVVCPLLCRTAHTWSQGLLRFSPSARWAV